jgi:hypothetical protein
MSQVSEDDVMELTSFKARVIPPVRGRIKSGQWRSLLGDKKGKGNAVGKDFNSSSSGGSSEEDTDSSNVSVLPSPRSPSKSAGGFSRPAGQKFNPYALVSLQSIDDGDN